VKGGRGGGVGKGRVGKRMEGEGKGNGGPIYEGRKVKGGRGKGRWRVPRLLRFPRIIVLE